MSSEEPDFPSPRLAAEHAEHADSLRARKKRRSRLAISDVATNLFHEHGFEQVTLAQIADAAEVSVKTIFNHFGSKEDLFFDRAGEIGANLAATIVDRPAGTTAIGALRTLLVENRVPFAGVGWEGTRDPRGAEQYRRFLATQERSPALRLRRLTFGPELEDLLRGVLGGDLRRDDGDPALRSLAAMLVAALQVRDRALTAAVLARAAPDEVRRQVVEVVEEAFNRLARAFADVDRVR